MRVFLLTLIFGTSLVLCATLKDSEFNFESELDSETLGFPEDRRARSAKKPAKLTKDDISK